MNIDIITLHRARNYGSILQTLALQKKMEEVGHQVRVLDYYPERYTNRGLLQRLKKKSPKFENPLYLLVARILIYPSYIKKSMVFERFLKHINLVGPRFANNDEAKELFLDADAYCTGSDQVWNSHWNEGVDKALFLNFVPENRLIFSYAASFGNSFLPDAEIEETKGLLDRYKYISVREDTGLDILKKVGREDGIQTLDPTLLLTKEEWNKYTDDSYSKNRYILTYNLHHDPEIDKYANELKHKYNIPVYNISYNWHDILRKGHLMWCPSIEGFLGLIKHAQFVIADSFHATVFSIIFEKQFVVITPEIAGSRISSVLKLFNLSERALNCFQDIQVIENPIDYEMVEKLLNKERENSMSFLRRV